MESFDDAKPSKRPAVQVGDPFAEKVLIECCLELFKASVVEGIQDLGAAGISCATSELASNGEGGMHVELTNVLLRDPSLTPGEILMSESQERMMAVVAPENVAAFEAIMEAGGFSKFANPKQVVVVRNQGGKHQRYALNLSDTLSGASDSAFYVRPYDTIYVSQSRW